MLECVPGTGEELPGTYGRNPGKMQKESLQKKIGRVRPPRVQITCDVETGAAIERRGLPFVVGVFVDLSGQPVAQQRAISQRRFVAIDRDNLDSVLRSIAPRIVLDR